METNESNQIPQWDQEFRIDKHGMVTFSSIFIAPRNSGKTSMVNYLLDGPLKDKFDNVIVFTTRSGIDEYAEFINPKLLFEGFQHDLIARIRDLNDEKELPYNVLVIMDDTNSRKEKFNSGILELYTNGRHSNISVIYCTQSPTLVDNVWKANSDYIFIWNPRTSRYRDYVVKNILDGVLDLEFEKTKEEDIFYKQLLRTITSEPHRALVVDMLENDITQFMIPEEFFYDGDEDEDDYEGGES